MRCAECRRLHRPGEDPLHLWGRTILSPTENGRKSHCPFQTDAPIRPERIFGFLVRFGGIPTNVGSGGVFNLCPIALGNDGERCGGRSMKLSFHGYRSLEIVQTGKMAFDHRFTYLLGPIKMALRPRVIRPGHIDVLSARSHLVRLSDPGKMWLSGNRSFVKHEEEELRIARSQVWGGSHAIFASDGLFSSSAPGGAMN